MANSARKRLNESINHGGLESGAGGAAVTFSGGRYLGFAQRASKNSEMTLVFSGLLIGRWNRLKMRSTLFVESSASHRCVSASPIHSAGRLECGHEKRAVISN